MAYQIHEMIGEGGFGIVHRVTDSNNKPFAMKQFRPSPGIDPDMVRRRFEKEVKYQTNFNHPNVVQILDSNLTENPPWFVMPLAIESLVDEMQRDKTLGANLSVALFDILSGLEALHSLGITHRDLKPGNVLKFANDDGSVRYAISDFGLITAVESQTTTLTQTNMGAGTPYYAPPECATDFKRATAQSDIYSFGAILFDIFGTGGRVPHTELSVPGHPIGEIIERCTKTLPLRRYQNVATLRADLYDLLSNQVMVFSSNEEEGIIALLKLDRELTDGEWDKIFIFLDDCENKNVPRDNMFRMISQSHVVYLSEHAPELLRALGVSFCEFVQHGTFDFGYCDILASKIVKFFEAGNVELKAHALLALLCMGTSHNRWYVENSFAKLSGADLNDSVAQRIIIEVELQGLPFGHMISHLERSISYDSMQLHPSLFIHLVV